METIGFIVFTARNTSRPSGAITGISSQVHLQDDQLSGAR